MSQAEPDWISGLKLKNPQRERQCSPQGHTRPEALNGHPKEEMRGEVTGYGTTLTTLVLILFIPSRYHLQKYLALQVIKLSNELKCFQD